MSPGSIFGIECKWPNGKWAWLQPMVHSDREEALERLRRLQSPRAIGNYRVRRYRKASVVKP